MRQSIRTGLRRVPQLWCAIALCVVCASAADRLVSFPLVFPRGDGMGGTGMSYGGSEEAVYRNPAWAASFRKLCITLPGLSLNIDHNFFSLMAYMEKHRGEFEQDTGAGLAPGSDGDAFFRDSVMREFDGKWFGLNSDIIDCSVLFRGFGVLLRSRFSADFAANRGLLFPFMLAEYGQMRELTIVYGRNFANDALQFGAGVKLLREQMRIVSVASNNIGKVDNEFWALSEDDWQHRIGLDLGLVGNIPGRRHLAASVRNIGLKTREQSVPDISFGYARDIRQPAYDEYSFVGDFTAALECVNMLSKSPWPSKVKMGGEIAFNLLPRNWLALHLRSGLNGGYLTFGVGVQVIKLVTVDYVTYAEEIGSYVGQEARRRHLLYGKVQFNFNRRQRAKDTEVVKDEKGETEETAPAPEQGDEEPEGQLPAPQESPPPSQQMVAPPATGLPPTPSEPLPQEEDQSKQQGSGTSDVDGTSDNGDEAPPAVEPEPATDPEVPDQEQESW